MADVQNVEHVAQIIHDDPVVPDAKPPESRAAEFCRVVREAVRVAGDLLNFVLNEARNLGGHLCPRLIGGSRIAAGFEHFHHAKDIKKHNEGFNHNNNKQSQIIINSTELSSTY